MTALKNKFVNRVKLEPMERSKLFHAIFYEAEKYSFTKKKIMKALAGVGMFPENPERIIKNAQENSPHEISKPN